MRFSSKENAIQHLADITGKRIVIGSNSGIVLIAKEEKPLDIEWFDSGANMEISIFNQQGDVAGSIWREYPDKHKEDWTLRLPGQKKTTSGTLAYCLEKVMKSGQQVALKVHPRLTKAEDKQTEEAADITKQPQEGPLEFEFGVEDSELLSKTMSYTDQAPSVGGLKRAPI
jgi:hypothetical protein